MPPNAGKRRARGRGDGAEPTAGLLLKAAMAEFDEAGFEGTDSNRIARRAGFAPQTFYRWYADKTEIFLAAYDAWAREEAELMRTLRRQDAPPEALADAAVAHHRAHLNFRRSLRRLSVERPEVRAARAESRLRQIEALRRWQGAGMQDVDALAVTLLQLERLSDALAEGEFADMGLSEAAGRAALAALIAGLRPK